MCRERQCQLNSLKKHFSLWLPQKTVWAAHIWALFIHARWDSQVLSFSSFICACCICMCVCTFLHVDIRVQEYCICVCMNVFWVTAPHVSVRWEARLVTLWLNIDCDVDISGPGVLFPPKAAGGKDATFSFVLFIELSLTSNYKNPMHFLGQELKFYFLL